MNKQLKDRVLNELRRASRTYDLIAEGQKKNGNVKSAGVTKVAKIQLDSLINELENDSGIGCTCGKSIDEVKSAVAAAAKEKKKAVKKPAVKKKAAPKKAAAKKPVVKKSAKDKKGGD